MNFRSNSIASILNSKDHTLFNDTLTELSIDSRTIIRGSRTLFIALPGEKHHGVDFIERVIQKGVRNIVVPANYRFNGEEKLNLFHVSSTLDALQELALSHRASLLAPIIGITGSNGKTIIKEWIFQLLHDALYVQRSPQSFNSQIGVALSLLKINNDADLVLIEAGISRPGEMVKLREMIRPEIGIITNIGDAHSSGFNDIQQKLEEKLKLFYSQTRIIYRRDHEVIHNSLIDHSEKISWSLNQKENEVDYPFSYSNQLISLSWHGQVHTAYFPFTDGASVENICHAIVASHHMLDDLVLIFKSIPKIEALDWRLDAHEDSSGKVIINDSYNSDITGFQKALEVLNVHAQDRESLVILSALEDQKERASAIYEELVEMLRANEVDRVWAINIPQKHQKAFVNLSVSFFESADDVDDEQIKTLSSRSAILIKGSRRSRLEQLSKKLQVDSSRSVLEVDMAAIGRNIGRFSRRLAAETKIMLMLKASSYGLGVEMGQFAQNQGIDMIGLAFASEALEMRRKGIHIPLLVMHMEKEEYRFVPEYDLIPLINSREEYLALKNYADSSQTYIECHLNLNTGMNRLGVDESLLSDIIDLMINSEYLKLTGVMTHLIASGDVEKDSVTRAQISKFADFYVEIAKRTMSDYDRHILNSDGILRFPQAQCEMVRLGIGMYGLSSGEGFECAVALKSRVVQLRRLPAGESIGYGGNNKISESKLIATIAMGYADGLPRKIGNGVFSVTVEGNKYPTIGDICMDFFMIDVTNAKKLIKLGQEVTIFAAANSLRELSDAAETIPYEIFSSIPGRVKREYHYHNQ